MVKRKEKKPVTKTDGTENLTVKNLTGSMTNGGDPSNISSSTATNPIKYFIKKIGFFSSFFNDDIETISTDFCDRVRFCFLKKKKLNSLETAKKESNRKKSWKEHPNSAKLQEMIDDGLLETYNTDEVEGLKIAKTFTEKKFIPYKSSFGSVKGFVNLSNEGILFSVRGCKLQYSTFIEYCANHHE